MKKLFIYLDNFNQDYVQELLEDTEESIQKFLEHLKDTLDCFYRRKDKVFYNSEDIKVFLDFFNNETLKGEYLTSLKENLWDILENAENWQGKATIIDNASYYHWDICAEKIEKIDNQQYKKTLAELTERILQEKKEHTYLLVLPVSDTSLYHCKPIITCFKDSFDSEETPKFIKIDYVESPQKANQWLLKNRIPLTMNRSNKHGENGKGQFPAGIERKISKLYCNIEEAQELLNKAIGDERIQENRVFNYDEKHQKFIVFFYEGKNPQNQYHAFHLDTEQEIQEQIPNKIQKELKEKFNLKN